jgi:hypothetical protein
MKKEDGNGNLSFLRRHYPDQVCGYFLSNPAINYSGRMHPGLNDFECKDKGRKFI